ncbi:hypothetical protein H8959_004863 [Pygathrix nigripes]
MGSWETYPSGVSPDLEQSSRSQHQSGLHYSRSERIQKFKSALEPFNNPNERILMGPFFSVRFPNWKKLCNYCQNVSEGVRLIEAGEEREKRQLLVTEDSICCETRRRCRHAILTRTVRTNAACVEDGGVLCEGSRPNSLCFYPPSSTSPKYQLHKWETVPDQSV